MIGSSLRYGIPNYGEIVAAVVPMVAYPAAGGLRTGVSTAAPAAVDTNAGAHALGSLGQVVAAPAEVATAGELQRLHNERENDGGVRNGRLFLLYFFIAFVIVRLWMLVAEQDNDVYTGLAIVAMTLGLVAYCRWRNYRRHIYENELNMALHHHNQHDFREIPAETVQQFLAIQAALRRAAINRNNSRIIPTDGSAAGAEHNARLLITAQLIESLPSIVYVEGGVSSPPRPVSPRTALDCGETAPTMPYDQRDDILMHGGDDGGGIAGDLESGNHQRYREAASRSPRARKSEREQDTVCMVCLADFVALDVTTVLPCTCGHRYHRDCIALWLAHKHTCPLCCMSLSPPTPTPTPTSATLLSTATVAPAAVAAATAVATATATVTASERGIEGPRTTPSS